MRGRAGSDSGEPERLALPAPLLVAIVAPVSTLSGSSKVAQNSRPRRSSVIARPWTWATVTLSKSATTVSGLATWVIVRWYEARHDAYWDGWQARHAFDDEYSGSTT